MDSHLCYSKTVNRVVATMDQIQGTFTREDWERISNALKTYVINEENRLSKLNVGDQPWTEVGYYNALISDIELYVLNK